MGRAGRQISFPAAGEISLQLLCTEARKPVTASPCHPMSLVSWKQGSMPAVFNTSRGLVCGLTRAHVQACSTASVETGVFNSQC